MKGRPRITSDILTYLEDFGNSDVGEGVFEEDDAIWFEAGGEILEQVQLCGEGFEDGVGLGGGACV